MRSRPMRFPYFDGCFWDPDPYVHLQRLSAYFQLHYDDSAVADVADDVCDLFTCSLVDEAKIWMQSVWEEAETVWSLLRAFVSQYSFNTFDEDQFLSALGFLATFESSAQISVTSSSFSSSIDDSFAGDSPSFSSSTDTTTLCTMATPLFYHALCISCTTHLLSFGQILDSLSQVYVKVPRIIPFQFGVSCAAVQLGLSILELITARKIVMFDPGICVTLNPEFTRSGALIGHCGYAYVPTFCSARGGECFSVAYGARSHIWMKSCIILPIGGSFFIVVFAFYTLFLQHSSNSAFQVHFMKVFDPGIVSFLWVAAAVLSHTCTVCWVIVLFVGAGAYLDTQVLNPVQQIRLDLIGVPSHIGDHLIQIQSGTVPGRKLIHKQIQECGLESNMVVAIAVMDMYGKFGSIEDACLIFDATQQCQHRHVPWNAMLAAYSCNRIYSESMNVFWEKFHADVTPDKISFVTALTSDFKIGNAAVSRFESPDDASEVYEKLLECNNVVSWNAMIGLYMQNDCWVEGVDVFCRILCERFVADQITLFILVMNVCADVALRMAEGKWVLNLLVQDGEIEVAGVLWNEVLNFFDSYGDIVARDLHEKGLQMREIVVYWHRMMAEYVCRVWMESMMIWKLLRLEGVMPNSMMFFSVLTVCGNLTVVGYGRTVRFCVMEKGMESEMMDGTGFVIRYGKCGSLKEVCVVFQKVITHAWNVLVAAYRQYVHVGVNFILKKLEDGGYRLQSGCDSLQLSYCWPLQDDESRWLHHRFLTSMCPDL